MKSHIIHLCGSCHTVKFHCRCSSWPGAILVRLLLQPIKQTAIQIEIFFLISMPNGVHVYYFPTCKPQNATPVCCGFVTLKPGANRTFYTLLYAFSHISIALHIFKYFSVTLIVQFFNDLKSNINIKCLILLCNANQQNAHFLN